MREAEGMKRIFVNANVVDVLTGSLLTQGQVLVEDGIIRAWHAVRGTWPGGCEITPVFSLKSPE